MPRLAEATLLAFRDELEKEAAIPWQALGGNVGSLMGVGGALGGAAGLLHGGYRGYREAREHGAGVGQSLVSGALSGGAEGARDAAIGAGVGGLAGAAGTAAPKLMSSLKGKLEAVPGLGAASRFGQRQVHGLTGWTPEGGLASIRGGSFDAEKRMGDVRDALSKATDHKSMQSALKDLKQARLGLAASRTAEEKGLTSLPGIARGLRHDAIGTLAAGAKNQWHSSDLASKALTVGFPAVSVARTLTKSDKSHEGEELGGEAAQLIGGAAMSALPMPVQLAAGAVAQGVGSRAGRLVDKVRQLRKPELEPAENTSHVAEHVLSPAAAGQIPEGV